MGKYEALEKVLNDDEYSKILMRQAEEYYKPAWEKVIYVKGEIPDGHQDKV